MSGNLNAVYNPALSFDIGAHMWAIGDDVDTAHRYDAPFVDKDTATFAIKYMDASYEAYMAANPPQEMPECPFSPQL